MFQVQGSEVKPPSEEGYIMIDNCTTTALRHVLYMMYKKRINPDWVSSAMEVLSACRNLEALGLIGGLIEFLKDNYVTDQEYLIELWYHVYSYRILSCHKMLTHRYEIHEKLHPGAPCHKPDCVF